MPPSTASGVIHDKKQARRQNDKERKCNLRLRDGQREQENTQRRADYRKNVDNGTIDLQQKNQNQIGYEKYTDNNVLKTTRQASRREAEPPPQLI